MSVLMNKACDRCRAKKIRCISSTESECAYCHSRELPCVFSYQKRRKRRRNSDELAQAAASRSPPAPCIIPLCQPYPVENRSESFPELYIDYLLERGPTRQTDRPSSNQDQLTTLIGPSPNISFFPAKRVHAISRKLGHNRLEHLLEAIRAVIASKLRGTSPLVTSGLVRDTAQDAEVAHRLATGPEVGGYIRTYMEVVHPFYPFLCPEDFQKRAAAPSLIQDLITNKAWACLYYAVVAVGCQHNDGGSYEAKSGASWAYFEQAMSYFPDLVFPKVLLTSVQALMALAIFCQPISAFGLESLMIAEAAVMAQNLGINRWSTASDNSSTQTFWVLYCMEKTSCFMAGRVPTLQDSHISCPLPSTTEYSFSDYDWLNSFIKFARLISKIQIRLFTITSIPQSWSVCHATVASLHSELERWRDSIPRRFRPGEPLRPRMLLEPRALSIALRTHYYYRYAYLTLIWTLLHCGSGGGDQAATAAALEDEFHLKTELMQTARGVLELTSYIDISPSTPVWMLALVPISALMILFDLVIHEPNHPSTSLNLALLDMASGHFSRIEYSSKGVLPGSLISEFAHLAREYVSNKRHGHTGNECESGASLKSRTIPILATNGSGNVQCLAQSQNEQHGHEQGSRREGQHDDDNSEDHSHNHNNISFNATTSLGTETIKSQGARIPPVVTGTGTGLSQISHQPLASTPSASGRILPSPLSSSFVHSRAVPAPAGRMVAMPTEQEQNQDQIFFNPDVGAQVDQTQYLGVDLMALFDPTFSLLGWDWQLQEG